LAEVYAESEVAAEAAALARSIDAERAQRSGGADPERARLSSVLAALERGEQAELATRVRTALAALEGVSAPKGGE
jgi:hypothetical protein